MSKFRFFVFSFKSIPFLLLFIFHLTTCTSTNPVVEEVVKETEPETTVVNKRVWNEAPICCNLNVTALEVVVLSKICVTQTETRLELFTKESKKVCVLKEGMVFQDNLGVPYAFQKSEGVGLCPKRTQMKNKPFSIYFDSISSEANSFDLIEDKNAKHAHKPWIFTKVDLSTCEWN
ncbi:hypothetical protein P3G55_16995 [Leptospira sp. 96542]|nr:hypothetical protein [Leptospira sp. 96542]